MEGSNAANKNIITETHGRKGVLEVISIAFAASK